jgi:hypothetical protein
MIWLGERRGYLADWLTQLWVRATGRSVDLGGAQGWLDGPAGPTRGIGAGTFDEVARAEGLEITAGGGRGILPAVAALASERFDPAAIGAEVRSFYERTSAYEIEAWAAWCGPFKPFGWLLAAIFSRRLEQLNVPLSGLDTSRGMTNEVFHVVEPATGKLRYAVWLRRLLGTQRVLYAGSYSVCRPPGYPGACVKVVFPLPNGSAMVIMRPEAQGDGSLLLVSAGERFGSPGFYFVVRGKGGRARARYVRSLRESIQVYAADRGGARADHVLKIWGLVFLRLHYRLRPEAAAEVAPAGN